MQIEAFCGFNVKIKSCFAVCKVGMCSLDSHLHLRDLFIDLISLEYNKLG